VSIARQQRTAADYDDLLPLLDVPMLVLHGRDARKNELADGRRLAGTSPAPASS